MMRVGWVALAFLVLIAPVWALNSSIPAVSPSSPEILVNKPASLFVVITNDSNGPVTTTLSMYDNDYLFFELAYTISAQADLNVGIPWTPTVDGNHQIKAVIDLNDDNLADNEFVASVIVFRGQDPAIQSVSIPPVFLPETTQTAQIIVQNVGDRITGFFTMRAFVDENNEIFSVRIDPLSPNSFKIFDVNVVAPALGSHSFRAQIDSNDLSYQFSTVNDQLQTNFVVSTSIDGNLSRDDILRIIDEYFKAKDLLLKEQLDSCQAVRDQAVSDLQGVRAINSACQQVKDECAGRESGLRNEITSLNAACDARVSQLSDADNAKRADLEAFYKEQMRVADLNRMAYEQIAKDNENMAYVLGALFFVLAAGITGYMIWLKGAPRVRP